MARLLITLLIGVTLMGTLACNGADRKTTLRKVGGGDGGSDQFAGLSKAAVEKSKEGACLRLDELKKAFATVGKDGLAVYMSDAALGRNESGEVDDFTPTEDLALAQEALIRGVDSGDLLINRPNLVFIDGSEFSTHSIIAKYTRGLETLDADCKTLKLKKSETAAAVSHAVVAHTAISLTVQNGTTNELIKYEVEGSANGSVSRLNITVTRSTDLKSVCSKELPPLVRQRYTISRQSKGENFLVSYDLAYMLSRFVQDSQDLRDHLESLEKGVAVDLPSAIFTSVIDSVQGNRFTREQCK